MLTQLRASRADQSYERRLARFASPDLLVLDDLGLRPHTGEEPLDLYEIIRERYERRDHVHDSALHGVSRGIGSPPKVLPSAHELSVARLVQHETGEGTAALHVVLHECRSGALSDALVEISQLSGTRRRPTALPVISDRAVSP